MGTAMDHRKFLRLYLGTQSFLRSYLFAATRDEHAAEDLLQEVSVVLWESFEQYDEARPFRPWAVGIARLHVLRWRASRSRSATYLSIDALEALTHAALRTGNRIEPRRAHLSACLDRLSDHARKVLSMRYEEACSNAEIAARLGKQVGAVEMALVRARRALRSCIEQKLAQTGASQS
jgi:RNA polymerase sigma-70 factor (ECF subfamily)